MREKCHKGLTELVFEVGLGYNSKRDLMKLLNASIEPDLENRRQIEENLDSPLKILPILSNWLTEHTSGARKLALENLEKAYYARLRNEPHWTYFLGLTFHYITDWATPYHSPISLAKKVIPYSILGGIGAILIKSVVNLINETNESQEGIAQWGLLGAGTASGISLITQYIKHNEFEKQCDDLWTKYEPLIRKKFNSLNISNQLPSSFEEAMKNFNQLMSKLRYTCENTSPDLILADGNNFVDYLIKIAIVMQYACKIIVNL